MQKYFRFLNDISYDFLIPPYGFDFRAMTPAQAKNNFAWFLEHIPERTQYLCTRCAKDLKIDEKQLNFSAESLIPVWRWFLKFARLEETPLEDVVKMEKAAKIYGESFINRTQFTIATQYMLRDVGMYLGQCFIRNYAALQWTYYTKPKSDVYVNQPIIRGFQMTYQGKRGELSFAPLHMAKVQAAKIFGQTQSDQDLLGVFEYWRNYIPVDDESGGAFP